MLCYRCYIMMMMMMMVSCVCLCVCVYGWSQSYISPSGFKKVKVLVFSPFHRVCFIYFISFQLFYSLKCVPCLCVFVFDRSWKKVSFDNFYSVCESLFLCLFNSNLIYPTTSRLYPPKFVIFKYTNLSIT